MSDDTNHESPTGSEARIQPFLRISLLAKALAHYAISGKRTKKR